MTSDPSSIDTLFDPREIRSRSGVIFDYCLKDRLDTFTYHQERFARTAQVQLGSRAIGDYIYHPSAGSAAARNAILGAKSAEDWFETLRWLYGHRAG